jgi:hypothetical protein
MDGHAYPCKELPQSVDRRPLLAEALDPWWSRVCLAVRMSGYERRPPIRQSFHNENRYLAHRARPLGRLPLSFQ